MDLLAAAPMFIAASSQASNWLFDPVPPSGPIAAGGPGMVVTLAGSPGMVPVFINDW